MKKTRVIAFATALCIAATSLSGCYGKFVLTKKLYEFNGSLPDKYIRSAATWVGILLPVYFSVAFLDFVLFNTIEFWSGHNPLALNDKSFDFKEGDLNYRVKAARRGDEVTYRISRFSGGNFVDSAVVRWNVRTGNSTACVTKDGKPREFSAVLNGNQVMVRETPMAPQVEARHLAMAK